MNDILVLAGIILIGIILMLVLIQNLLIVVPPNKVLVISGRARKTPEGDTVGYRVIRGGRAFRIPVLEKVAWLDLTTIPLDLSVENAYSKGGIPLKIHAVANVKINAEEPYLSNAIERFLEVPREAITSITRDTLEGNLRGVIATLTPEEINEDRLRFAEALIEEAEHDMSNLGIKLDTLKIQNVSDGSGYLESIGRRKTADVLKEARVAEAERNAEATQAEAQALQRSQVAQAISQQAILEEQNKLEVRRTELGAVQLARQNEAAVESELARVRATQAFEQERAQLEAALRQRQAQSAREARVIEAQQNAEAAEVEAQAQQRAQIAQTTSQQAILERQNELRVRTAELNAIAAAKENESKVAAERARVVAEQQLEQERIVLNQKKYEADVIAPARAQREARLLEAQAAAAPIIEEGRAKAEAVRLLVEAFRNAGPEGERAFILNMLPGIVSEFAQSVRDMSIDKVTVIDSGNGQATRSAISTLPMNIVSLVEQVETSTGVNLLSLLQNRPASEPSAAND
ncbi:flotillin family protein [Deinococcus maricopensis]|uniref:Band 7 protein n=1 Tax=Deinococcus maricopensis (strain DSM 21211 / LMG 22137 / NRRL B-23946 / LB-34) TaxID=709986 RepID=E8UA81_DEIML|nr:SPFH domain-containing protein [Deinococcus maricopensis]ADV67970.1 band 7 protein [Deinococcus maricopensis DSM 21211]